MPKNCPTKYPPKTKGAVAPTDYCALSGKEKCQLAQALDLSCLTPAQLETLATALAPYLAGKNANCSVSFGCVDGSPGYQVCAGPDCNHYNLAGEVVGPDAVFTEDCDLYSADTIGPLCVTEGMMLAAEVMQVTWNDLANPGNPPTVQLFELGSNTPFELTGSMSLGACAGNPSLAVPGCLTDLLTGGKQSVFQIRPYDPATGGYTETGATYALTEDGSPVTPGTTGEFTVGPCTTPGVISPDGATLISCDIC